VIGSVILMEARGRGRDLCGVPTEPTSHNCVIFEPRGEADRLTAMGGPGDSHSDVIMTSL
jgi:hypothetical protein